MSTSLALSETQARPVVPCAGKLQGIRVLQWGWKAHRPVGLLATPELLVMKKSLGDVSVTCEIHVYCNLSKGMNRICKDLSGIPFLSLYVSV